MKEKKLFKPDTSLLKRYVGSHSKQSRLAESSDIETIKKDSTDMFQLLYLPYGHYKGGYAIAHPQINKTDPIRFFVTIDQDIIINPTIIKHTNAFVNSDEGCLDFPNEIMVTVQRFNKITVKYQELNLINDNFIISDTKTKELSGFEAKVWQHEIDHLNGVNIMSKEHHAINNINKIKKIYGNPTRTKK